MFRVTGEVVRFQRRPWSMDGRSGVTRTARVLVGRADFCDVTVPEEFPEPREGDSVDWAVEVSVRNGRLRVVLAGDFAVAVPGYRFDGAVA